MIFVLLYMVFHSVTEAAVLIFPTIYALTGGLILQRLLGYNFSVAVWVGYIALFGIAVETGVVMVVYLHEALDRRLKSGVPLRKEDIEAAVIEGAVQRLRPKLMTVCRGSCQPGSHSVGNRRRLRCDEANCRAYRRRHDHFNDSRLDSRPRVFRVDEGTCASSWNTAAERTKCGRCVRLLIASSALDPRLGRVLLQIRMVAGCAELLQTKEQLIAEGGFEPPSFGS